MTYERGFIPTDTLFETSGSDAVRRFGDRSGRNLAIVTESTLPHLERVKREERRAALAANDALLYLYARSSEISPFESERRFTTPVRIGDTLDLSFTNHTQASTADLGALVDAATSEFGLRPTVITPEPSMATSLKLYGISAERPDFLIVGSDIVNRTTLEGTDELLAAIETNGGSLSIEEAEEILGVSGTGSPDGPLFANQLITWEGNRENLEYARVRPQIIRNTDGYLFERGRTIERMHLNTKRSVLGVRPQELEQAVALEHVLLNDDVTLGFITGSQGSGKTILTYAAAVQSILERRSHKDQPGQKEQSNPRYRQIVLFKSNDIMGGADRNLGFLPGDTWAKIAPIMDSYADAHNETAELSRFHFSQMLMHPLYANLVGERSANLPIKGGLMLPMDRAAIELAYSGFVRGRTFIDSYIIIDEAQNFTPYEIKTLIERAGRGSKIIISGDPHQTDNPRCSIEINGLTAAMKHYLGRPYVAGIHLMKNWRSQASSDSKTMRVF